MRFICSARNQETIKATPFLKSNDLQLKVPVNYLGQTTKKFGDYKSSKMNTVIFATFCIISSFGYLEVKPVAEIQGRSGFVYVLRQAASNFYKVGLTSGNIADRIKKLQTGKCFHKK